MTRAARRRGAFLRSGQHLKKDLHLFNEIAHVSPLAKNFIAAIEEIVQAAAAEGIKLDYSSLHERVKAHPLGSQKSMI